MEDLARLGRQEQTWAPSTMMGARLCGIKTLPERVSSARRTLDGVVMPVPRRSIEPGRPRHRRAPDALQLISTQRGGAHRRAVVTGFRKSRAFPACMVPGRPPHGTGVGVHAEVHRVPQRGTRRRRPPVRSVPRFPSSLLSNDAIGAEALDVRPPELVAI